MLTVIRKRRSVRRFKKKAVSAACINNILEAGRWAPSGLNNQPWRFMVLKAERKDALSQFTHYGHIIESADTLILVFLDKETSYNYEKDLMAVGAAIENMLLYIHSQRLGAVWLGEILNQRNKIHKFLNTPSHLQLEAVIALGYPSTAPQTGRRKPLKKLLVVSP